MNRLFQKSGITKIVLTVLVALMIVVGGTFSIDSQTTSGDATHITSDSHTSQVAFVPNTPTPEPTPCPTPSLGDGKGNEGGHGCPKPKK